jgi:uncharacterized membrane protein YhhN
VPFAIALTAFGGAAALFAAGRTSRVPYAAGKLAAAAGFVWLALAAGALASLPGSLTLAGLAASGAGDLALALRGRAAFVAGIAAFALAHLAYAAAFVARGVAPPWLAVAALALATISLGAWRWLRPRLPRELVAPIAGYVVLVTAMPALAWASFGAGGPLLAALGATAFYLSDLGVARERFVAPDGRDKLWALPLYYLGQVLIALSV